MPADLSNTKVLIVVFAMPGCPACKDYLPKFQEQLTAFQEHGHPFVVWEEGSDPLAPGQIPVMIYDATSSDKGIQDFANKYDVTGLPSTIFLPRVGGHHKLEGDQDPDTIYRLFATAVAANH